MNEQNLGNNDDSSLLPSETHKAPTEQEARARSNWLATRNAPAHYVLMTAWEMEVIKELKETLREQRDEARAEVTSLSLKNAELEAGERYLQSRVLAEIRPGTFAAVDEHVKTYIQELRALIKLAHSNLDGCLDGDDLPSIVIRDRLALAIGPTH